jgi:NADPH:quinone reductase-like Zn-dependent oxidoreductase
VTKFNIGDRVATLFNPGHQFGPLDGAAMLRGGVGGTEDGTFQEYGVYDETGVVRLASNLSYIEGATLSDAAVTAWNALYGGEALKPGDWVLVQGTGGVSLFAVQVSYVTDSPLSTDIQNSVLIVSLVWHSSPKPAAPASSPRPHPPPNSMS